MVPSTAADDTPGTTMEQVGLSGGVLVAARDAGFLRPTAVQAALIPATLKGENLVARAPAGTGRVTGLALAVAQRLDALALPADGDRRPVVGVVAFTADDVQQTAAVFESVLGERGAVVPAHSGTRVDRVAAALRRGPVCVVGTPGRMSDLVEKGALDLGALRVLVLLEVDLLLSVGAADGLDRVLRAIRAGQENREVQLLAVAAGTDPEVEGFLTAHIPGAAELQFPETCEGLVAMSPALREVAEDEKSDVVAGLADDMDEGSKPLVVLARTEREAAAVSAHLQRRAPKVDVSVGVDGDDGSEEGAAAGRRVVLLHPPVRPSEWTAAVGSGEATILVSPAEYWDYARTGWVRVERVSKLDGKPQPVQERVKRKRRGVSTQPVAPSSVSTPDTPALTEAERVQRRYIQRDAARKIERIDPEDASKEAARLVKESMLEAAFLQAFAPEAVEAGGATPESTPGAQDRALSEMLRRREVDERLREARRKLRDQEEPVEAAAQGELVAQVEPVAQVEAEPLDEREQSLVAWAQQARTKVRNLLDRGSGTDAPEYRVLAEHLLAGTDATEVVAALLRAVAPVPSSPGSSEEPGERGWARLFVSVGRTARVHKEQVEELLREKAGLSAEQIGRIDVLSRYTFLEVCGDVAEQVIERLSGEVLRGREITVARAKPPRNG